MISIGSHKEHTGSPRVGRDSPEGAQLNFGVFPRELRSQRAGVHNEVQEDPGITKVLFVRNLQGTQSIRKRSHGEGTN